MTQIAPSNPFMRKMMLPSIIRISDAWSGRTLSRRLSRSKPLRPSKATVASHSLRAVMGQLRLELE